MTTKVHLINAGPSSVVLKTWLEGEQYTLREIAPGEHTSLHIWLGQQIEIMEKTEPRRMT